MFPSSTTQFVRSDTLCYIEGMARKRRKIYTPLPRRTLTGLIIEKIAEASEVFLDAFFPAKYPEARLWRNILGLDPTYEFKPKTFAAILSRLKDQGLAEGRKSAGRTAWRITKEGRKYLAEFSQELNFPESDGVKRVVVFDIPEKEREKRRWLRGELVAMRYQQLQKSVWMGEVPLPEEFIDDLDSLQLRGKVHIFKVESEGTIS